MLPHEIFLISSLYFFLGIALSSINIKPEGVGILVLIVVTTLLSLYLKTKKKSLLYHSGLVVFLIVGSVYTTMRNAPLQKPTVPYGTKIVIEGIVASDPIREVNGQKTKIEIKNLTGNFSIIASLPPYPELRYGDLMRGEGSIEEASHFWEKGYFKKEGVVGKTRLFSIEKEEETPSLKRNLFEIKKSMIRSQEKVLGEEEATLLSGITLGAQGGFSKKFKEAMKGSGTTHIVALSGYNITVIIGVIMATLGKLITRKKALIIAFIIVMGFVVMTGAESSVVRAAVMALLAFTAEASGRISSMKSIIVLTGLMMALWNPNVLMFDLGFELSFLALMGVMYVKPFLENMFKIKKDKQSFLSWRENALTTAGAQLAVMPLLVIRLGNISLVSLMANVCILETVPIVMGAGFLLNAVSLFSYQAALVIGWFASILLKFQIGIIGGFAAVNTYLGTTGNVCVGVLFLFWLLYWLKIIKRTGQKI